MGKYGGRGGIRIATEVGGLKGGAHAKGPGRRERKQMFAAVIQLERPGGRRGDDVNNRGRERNVSGTRGRVSELTTREGWARNRCVLNGRGSMAVLSSPPIVLSLQMTPESRAVQGWQHLDREVTEKAAASIQVFWNDSGAFVLVVTTAGLHRVADGTSGPPSEQISLGPISMIGYIQRV